MGRVKEEKTLDYLVNLQKGYFACRRDSDKSENIHSDKNSNYVRTV